MERTKALMGYTVLSTAYIFTVLIGMVIGVWFRYCYWEFGLIAVKKFTNISDFQDETTIIDVEGDACGSLKSLISKDCPNVCEHINAFEISGIVMWSFSFLSCIATMYNIFFHLRVLSNPTIRVKTITFFMSLPLVFFTIGLGTFIGFGSLISNGSNVTQANSTQDFQIKTGLYIAFANYGFCVMILAYGCIFTRKVIYKKIQ